MVAESGSALLVKVGSNREIVLKSETVLGRHAECDVLLTEGHASRRHAKAVAEADGAWVEDLGSSNGTFINGSRITGRVQARAPAIGCDSTSRSIDFRVPARRQQWSVPDESKTVYRPPDSAAVVAESSGMYKRPGAWADPDAMGDGGANKTKFHRSGADETNGEQCAHRRQS